MSHIVTTRSPSQTKSLAKKLASLLQPGDIISLTGDLGAGKTCFTQGLAQGLNIKSNITSPTFNIIKEYYSGSLPLYHFDVYRFQSAAQLIELGYEEYFFGRGVTIIEWGDRILTLFPPDYLEIEFTRLGERVRQLRISAHGVNWQKKIKRWLDGINSRI